MSLVINTNVSSLNAQNNLTKSKNALSQATARLSSGLKINSAADNAAGFAISQRYTTQIGGLSQASSNASDAINLAQTAGSALDQVTSNLQAIRDLAVQSANGTYTDADRSSIDQEVQQRLAEITRIANQTTFNGSKVLDGSMQTKSFQIGADVGQTISVSLGTSVKSSAMGQVAEVSTGDISSAFATGASVTGAAAKFTSDFSTTNGKFDVDGKTVTLSKDYSTDQSTLASDVQTQLGSGYAVSWDATNGLTIAETAQTGASVPASAAPAITNDAGALFGATPTPAAGTNGTIATEGLSINGTAIDTSGVKSLQDLSDAINAAGVSGVSAAVSGDGKGINFYSSAGLKIADTKGGVIGTNAKDVNAGATYTAGTDASVGGSLSTGSVSTVDKANDLISRVDVALKTVSDFAAQLGAVQNRFQSTISTVAAQTTNLQASQSTIQDADFAAETANLSKAQVLQQAGISVLAQANSNPQQVLKLLQ
ncbi:flagellin [Dyella jiangningensis]|uniref:Flagellin n=1 Tax=Dyella jiangningensis TaxID=1379159 RepID=A0A328P8R8_9GAMM|nr:flagellin [Dyella jiangningensis]RAO77222.1 flagellin/flagellar hook associated protein [Dyella jiangningensis]